MGFVSGHMYQIETRVSTTLEQTSQAGNCTGSVPCDHGFCNRACVPDLYRVSL